MQARSLHLADTWVRTEVSTPLRTPMKEIFMEPASDIRGTWADGSAPVFWEPGLAAALTKIFMRTLTATDRFRSAIEDIFHSRSTE